MNLDVLGGSIVYVFSLISGGSETLSEHRNRGSLRSLLLSRSLLPPLIHFLLSSLQEGRGCALQPGEPLNE